MEPTYIVTDVGFGDAGKGTVVDWLARRAPSDNPPIVVRHCGGPQAAHNVITPEGIHHTFSQFGSGMFVPGCETHISRFMLFNPLNLMNEMRHLARCGVRDALSHYSISENAFLITPMHQAITRADEEARIESNMPHGSTGQGVSGLMKLWTNPDNQEEMFIRAKDMLDPDVLKDKFTYWNTRHWLSAPKAVLEQWLAAALSVGRMVNIVNDDYLNDKFGKRMVIFEGSQGTLLDEWHGFHPYTTWATTTTEHARQLAGDHPVISIGVTRTFHTRHGAGPFPSFDVAPFWHPEEPHNGTGRYQGAFRTGTLDLELLKYGIAVAGGIDCLAVTHVDHCPPYIFESYANLPILNSNVEDSTRLELIADGIPRLTWNPEPSIISRERENSALRSQALTTEALESIHNWGPKYYPCEDLLVAIDSIAPIALLSHGPTADDKEIVNPLNTYTEA